MLKAIQIKILDPRIGDTHPLPSYQTTGSAGLDLYASIKAPQTLMPGQCELIPTGIAIHINNPNTCAVLAPRSGLGHKKGIVLGNLIGIIDSDYQGEIKISCWNRGSSPQIIQPLERIAQLMFIPIFQPILRVVEEFEETERGGGGFGSTGT